MDLSFEFLRCQQLALIKNIYIPMSQFKDFFKKMGERAQLLKAYWHKSPTAKIVLINTGVYLMWKVRFVPEEFMVKHFSCERFNVSEGRLHTLLTHSFSHMGIFSLMFDLLMVGIMGRAIQGVGNKYIYWLYGLGTIMGGITGSLFQRPSPYIQPQVGCESVIAAYLTFLAMLNPQAQFYLFFFPVRAWVLVALLGFYSLVSDPQKKYFSGITAGLTVYQMRRVNFL